MKSIWLLLACRPTPCGLSKRSFALHLRRITARQSQRYVCYKLWGPLISQQLQDPEQRKSVRSQPSSSHNIHTTRIASRITLQPSAIFIVVETEGGPKTSFAHEKLLTNFMVVVVLRSSEGPTIEFTGISRITSKSSYVSLMGIISDRSLSGVSVKRSLISGIQDQLSRKAKAGRRIPSSRRS